MIMKWRHTSGFSVHNKVRIARDDSKGQEALAQISEQSETSVYHQKPVFLKKVHYRQETGQVIYRSKMSHGKNKKNFQVFSVLDFIAAITQHIPEQSFQLVRYSGVSFLAYLDGTPIACVAIGKSVNRRRRKQRLLPA
jgi:hypothetical protein